MVESINVLPPLICQKYDKKLLTYPTPDFCDNEKLLLEVYNRIIKRFERKKYSKQETEKVLKLKLQFEELYERIKKKKEEQTSEILYKAQEMFYRIVLPKRSSNRIFNGFVHSKAIIQAIYFRKDSKIQKRKK